MPLITEKIKALHQKIDALHEGQQRLRTERQRLVDDLKSCSRLELAIILVDDKIDAELRRQVMREHVARIRQERRTKI